MKNPIKAIKQQQDWAKDIVEEIQSEVDAGDLDVHLLIDVLAILGLKIAKTTPVGINAVPITAAAYMHLCAPAITEQKLYNGELA